MHANWEHLRWVGALLSLPLLASVSDAARPAINRPVPPSLPFPPNPSRHLPPPLPCPCSGNAFALLVFGRMVEEEEGAFGLWLTYLLAGVGGTVASYLTSPHTHTISLGASGAVFGLFMVSIIAKFKPSLRRLLEFVILGQFVVKQVGEWPAGWVAGWLG